MEREGLDFTPYPSTYGYLGVLNYMGKPVVSIFDETFYVFDGDFPINKANLKYIQDIQEKFSEKVV